MPFWFYPWTSCHATGKLLVLSPTGIAGIDGGGLSALVCYHRRRLGVSAHDCAEGKPRVTCQRMNSAAWHSALLRICPSSWVWGTGSLSGEGLKNYTSRSRVSDRPLGEKLASHTFEIWICSAPAEVTGHLSSPWALVSPSAKWVQQGSPPGRSDVRMPVREPGLCCAEN